MQLTALLDAPPTLAGHAATSVADDFDRLVAAMVPCRCHNPDLWFAEHTSQIEQAKALCRTCPACRGCLAGAVERAEPWGVWGGEVFLAGQVVPTKRGRGRPRKAEASPAA